MASVLRTENSTVAGANHSKAVNYIRVDSAEYVSDYKVRVNFNDGTQQLVDFGHFLREHPHPQYNKYRDINLFKSFSVDMGNIVWGENWDLIFPIEQLHQGKIN